MIDATSEEVREWRIQELRRCRFSRRQREALMVMIELEETSLSEIRDLIDKHHATPEQAFRCILGAETVYLRANVC